MKHFRTFSLLTICLFLAHLAAAQTSETTAVPAEATKGSTVLPAISGSGTTNYIPKWTSSSALGNSLLYQTGGNVGIGTTTPNDSLDVKGQINTSQDYRIANYTVLATPGSATYGNISLCYQAFTGGNAEYITAVGTNALSVANEAFYDTAVGYNTLASNTSGSYNTAIGYNTLVSNTYGAENIGIGSFALELNTTGDNNIAIGVQAADSVSGGNSNNIHIGSQGTSSDNGVIRIGTVGAQTSFFAAGIYGASSGSSGAIPVLVDSSGQLVTVSSSRRFKEDIQDMGDASRDLMRLRPVTFRYRKPLADGSQPIQYGLIAEEVAEVYPDLVSY